jgi:hypothetical protein
MANKRREANRAKSKGAASMGERTYGDNPVGGTGHGSPKETAEFHGGKEQGAGQHPMLGPGPGTAAGGVKPEQGENPMRKTPGGDAKGMKNNSESEDD